MAIIIKTEAEIEKMRAAGRLAARTLDFVSPHIKPGVTTGEINDLCAQFIADHGAACAPLHYAPPGRPPYPKSICTSVNHQVCHGVPSDDKKLRDGDILNVDVTAVLNGYHGDTGRMFYVGEPSVLARRLCEVTRECLELGIRAARPGGHLGDIGWAIQKRAEAADFSVVREYCGHGLGRAFHEEPQVLHYGRRGDGIELRPNMTFTIEPMINAGSRRTKVLADGWTVVTRDRSLSAQWEHTVRITADGCEVLTLSDGETP